MELRVSGFRRTSEALRCLHQRGRKLTPGTSWSEKTHLFLDCYLDSYKTQIDLDLVGYGILGSLRWGGRTVSLLCQTFLWGALLVIHRHLRVYQINSTSWPGQEQGRPGGLYTMNWGPREVQNQDTKAGGGCGKLVALRSLWASPPHFPLQPQLTWMAQLVWGGC